MNRIPIDVHSDAEKHADAIILVCSCHGRDYDRAMVRLCPYEMELVPTSLQAAFETLPTAKLGIFDHLPVELIFLVLRNLDISSFFHFRQINRRARILSTGLYEYQLVSKYGLEGLRGLLRAGLAHCFTIIHLYRPLLSDKSSTCGDFGGLLFLFTAERCCSTCLQSSARYRVLPPFVFARLAHISPSRLLRLSVPTLQIVPSTYDLLLDRPTIGPRSLILEEQAIKTLLTAQAVTQEATQNLRSRRDQRRQRFMAATAYPCYSSETAQLERGVSCRGCQDRWERSNDKSDWLARQRTFSAKDFLSHFSVCVEAQNMWAESEKGDWAWQFIRGSGLD